MRMTYWPRLLCWSGLLVLAEGTFLGLMIWLLFDSVIAQVSLQNTLVFDDGPQTLFALSAMGLGWINARMISHLWGVGWSAVMPLSALTLATIGIGWFVTSLLLPPLSPDFVEILVMVGIVMGGTSAVGIRFEW